uniref:Uncharacterized protein n=1 Tax=Globisporangium ultimum (strain ATCC 200006 / CBS 805.95 / DAOM BR144) TaxID=431595 RepID=K3XA06_GLOUD
MHELLVEHAIVQIYEIVVSFESGSEEDSGYEGYAKRFSKNIRFGRNGRITLKPIVASVNSEEKRTGHRNSFGTSSSLFISLKLQGSENAIEVYRHGSSYRTLPTIQSLYRSILRILAEHGIKESLQHNPFVAQENKVKRQVEIRVINEQTNSPVEKAHVFIEKTPDNIHLSTSLAKKIVPTLTMGSLLVSVRRRLQMKRHQRWDEGCSDFIAKGCKTYAVYQISGDAETSYAATRSKQRILEQVKESERGRIYSRNGPIRLKQLYERPLVFSQSEKELLGDFSEFGLQRARECKKCYATDANGRASCRLTPGSYSLYIFHLDYFEWTSLVVVFPFGSQGGNGISCSLVQDVLVPLETFRWTYKIQLVDFYDQNQTKKIAHIPIHVTDKVTSQRYTMTTDERGCAVWDVGKGLYSVTVSKESYG